MGFDLQTLLINFGYIGVFGIIFAESGLLIGFFLPGDSLLFTAGILAHEGIFNIYALYLTSLSAAILGDNVGYSFGRRIGRSLFTRKESLFFNKENLKRTEDFYIKHGPNTLILARFIPVVRTFAPIIAGIGDMKYKTFVTYNFVGGLLWTGVTLLGGYFLGSKIPGIDKYLLPIVVGIILVSIVPGVFHILGDKKRRAAIFKELKHLITRS